MMGWECFLPKGLEPPNKWIASLFLHCCDQGLDWHASSFSSFLVICFVHLSEFQRRHVRCGALFIRVSNSPGRACFSVYSYRE